MKLKRTLFTQELEMTTDELYSLSHTDRGGLWLFQKLLALVGFKIKLIKDKK